MKQFLIALEILLTTATIISDVSACQRCGLFGTRCRYYKAPVQYVAPVQSYQAPSVFVVQNNYPTPIGAYAAQGNSIYGVQAAAQAYFVNPAEVIRQAAELSKAATATASLGITGFGQIAQMQLAIQEPLARGQAAAQVLTAAGLSSTIQQPLSLALKVSQSSTGQWQVQQVAPEEVNAQIQQKTSPVQAPQSTSLIGQKCGKCHGLNIAEPKGGIFLDTGHKLTCEIAMKALQLVKADKMPKDAPLSNQEKALFLEELLTLSNPLE